jgi:hypothetical protein
MIIARLTNSDRRLRRAKLSGHAEQRIIETSAWQIESSSLVAPGLRRCGGLRRVPGNGAFRASRFPLRTENAPALYGVRVEPARLRSAYAGNPRRVASVRCRPRRRVQAGRRRRTASRSFHRPLASRSDLTRSTLRRSGLASRGPNCTTGLFGCGGGSRRSAGDCREG